VAGLSRDLDNDCHAHWGIGAVGSASLDLAFEKGKRLRSQIDRNPTNWTILDEVVQFELEKSEFQFMLQKIQLILQKMSLTLHKNPIHASKNSIFASNESNSQKSVPHRV
jgi:hypothetical protein